MIVWGPDTHHPEHYARKVLEAAMYLHVTFKRDQWLWRGQAQHKTLSPGMHTRVLGLPKARRTTDEVIKATKLLLDDARRAGLDEFDGVRLPDLALLSHLQHHGAATPLLDVTVDPLVALWMAANASVSAPEGGDRKLGYLFAIRKPVSTLEVMDARSFADVSQAVYADGLHWYRSPDVSERLRIQRGSFIIGTLDTSDVNSQTIPLGSIDDSEWVSNRMERQGLKNAVTSRSDAFAIKIRGACKPYLRKLLSERCGLDLRSIFPTPWHRPFVEDFATSHGRSRAID